MEVGAAGQRPRQHALELVLGPVDDARVLASWDVLEEVGVRSSARHRGTTHRPHVTVLSGPRPGGDVLRVAADLWQPLLPHGFRVAGLAILGGPRVALVELLAADLLALTARETLRDSWPSADARPWVPHLTLAPRLSAADLARAVPALHLAGAGSGGRDGIPERVVTGLRWWDPDEGTVHELVPQPS